MTAVCTYCSAEKSAAPGRIPALQRYRSRRISDLAATAAGAGDDFLILSGSYGLITPETPLPWYDHLLQAREVPELADRAAGTLAARKIGRVVYHTADPGLEPDVRPYLDVIRLACAKTGVPLEIVILPGTPV